MQFRMPTGRILGVLLLTLLVSGCLFAQEITGSIAGTVNDSTGAVVPNSTVTITNTDKNSVVRTVKTDSSGYYSAPLLPLGTYSVGITAPGFKGIVRSGIVVNVGSKLTQNFELPVGSSGETVNVQADASQVELQSSAASGLINGTQVRELALNGRNWAQLMTLQPGVSDAGNADQLYVGAFAPQGTNLITFSLNGGRREENNYMVDGADNVDRGSNLTLLAFPSIDAIAEFKVVRGQYDPELGRSASGQVNVITKSGTADLHGNIYEFFRNDALNANNYFNKRAQLTAGKPNKPPYLRYHDFGGTIGGPVWIPKIYEQRNKTFFFFSEEARRNITYSNGTAEVPTAAFLQGNFAHPVCTHVADNCPGGVGLANAINPASFDPVAAAYIKDVFSKYPQPNNGSVADPFNYISTLKGIFNYREEIYKIDHIFSTKFQVSGKILRDNIPTREPGGLFTNLGIDNIGNTDTNSPAHNYTFHATIVPSSSSLIDAGYFYSYGAILSSPNNLLNTANSPTVASTLKLPFTTTLGRIPSLSLSGGTGPATFGPYNDFDQNHQVFGNYSKVIGSHTIKVGATYYHYRKNENNANGNQGTFTFSNAGAPTGTLSFEQSFANFLIGKASRFQQSGLDLTADIRDNTIEYYGQDSWRVKPNLTITYGMRHSIFREPYDGKGMLENFDPRFYDPSKAPCILSSGATDVTKSPTGTITSACNPNFNPLNGYIFAHPPAGGTQSPYGDKVSAENYGTFAPRFGFAWDPFKNGKTSIRGGFGLFFDSGMTFGNAENDIFTGIGFQNQLDFSTNVTFANPTGGAPVPSTGIAGAATALQSRIDPSGTHPYTQQWSLDVQRDVYNGWILDVGYYGNSSIHLPGFLDLNQPGKNAYLKCTVATPCFGGPGSTNPVNFSNSMKDPVSGNTYSGNFISNGVNGSTANFNKLNAIRPYIGYLGMQTVRNVFTANYNALQSQLQKKFKNNTMLGLAYTWSHGLTTNQADRTTGAILPLQGDFKGVYGPTVGDRRHVFTGNFVWNLPWFQKQQGFIGHVLGGWELSGIQTMQTGLPATVSSAQTFDATGADCLGSSPCSFRVNQIGDPNPGTPKIFTQWFNKGAFTEPAPTLVNGVWVAQTDWPTERPGAVRLPGFWRTDLSLFKNLKFTERFGGQFRLETFNIFNHVNPVCCSSFATSNANFNKVVTTRDPRYIELALKLNF
jgi:hypothetical protein